MQSTGELTVNKKKPFLQGTSNSVEERNQYTDRVRKYYRGVSASPKEVSAHLIFALEAQ